MKPKRILIARHGESEGNVDKSVYAHTPDYTLPLTVAGRAQAQDLGRRIAEQIGHEPIHFYVSPWRRTRETFMGAVSALERAQWTATEGRDVACQLLGMQQLMQYMPLAHDNIDRTRWSTSDTAPFIVEERELDAAGPS